MTPDNERDGGHTTATTTAAARGDELVNTSAHLQHGPLDDARFPPGHIFASRHRIVSLLGRGAMGEVYRAEDLKLGQPVAIKLLGPSGARSRRVQRFVTEVRLARTISHPNVCRVYDIGEADGWWYIAMELVDGETLQSLLRRIGRLPDEKALDITRQLCAGLAAAHDHGVVHRDLKPSNIMVDGRGRIRIMDFGLAVPSGEWPMGEIAGTPAYMAPEQVAGEAVTERTDVYAIGLLIYELYVGVPLYRIRTIEERRTVSGVPSFAPISPRMDPEIERIVRACLDDDPAKRPPSVLAIAARVPGGDPLAVAIAGGMLPSPEMVAAAGPKGALRPGVGWAMLIATAIGILVVARQAEVVSIGPSDVPKPPEVLAQRARDILAGVGAGDVEVDSAFWFAANPPRPRLSLTGATLDRNDEGTDVTFVFRRSPIYLVPQNLMHVVTAVDPPDNIPGMATVTLHPLGHLLGFTRLLPTGLAPATSVPATDWAALFREAGLDASMFAPVEPDHTPQVPYDTRLAWSQPSASGGLRVTAATLDGRLVQFAITRRGKADPGVSNPPLSTGSSAADLAIWTLILLVLAGSAVLARYNLRRGEGDRLGARRLGMLVVCLSVLSAILSAHHVPIALEEFVLLFGATGVALTWGCVTWLVYYSLEPYLRRLWPRTLISWNRLLSGRLRDPLVGRDLLIGMLAGVITRLILVLVSISTGAASTYTASALGSLGSVPHFLNAVLPLTLTYSVVGALTAVSVLLLIRLIVRKTWITVGLSILVAIPLSGVSLGWPLIFVLAAALVTVTVFLRVGLLAYVAVYFTDLLLRVPVTLDPNAWYFGYSLVVLLITAAVASVAFLVSLGGRPAFGGSAA